jgi:hypothetical protein
MPSKNLETMSLDPEHSTSTMSGDTAIHSVPST